MILVRNVFRLKYGQARPALAVFKEAQPLFAKLSQATNVRAMTDLTGPAYTLVSEETYPSLAAWESDTQQVLKEHGAEFRAWFQKFMPFVESGSREVFTIIE